MKAKLWLTLALVVVLATAVVACSKLKKQAEKEVKGVETPTTTPTTTTEGSVTKSTSGNTTTFAGTLRGVNDSNKFDVFLNKDKVSVVFTYPSGAVFHVKVLGMTGNELGDFNLAEGETIDLTGGGKFSLIVYSTNGDGAWTGTYTE